MMDLQFFVPFAAYAIQLAWALLGAGVLLCTGKALPRCLLLGSTYPLGATLVGLVQWAAFVLGFGNAALVLIASLAAVVLAGVGVRLAWRGTPVAPVDRTAPWTWAVVWALLGVVALLGLLVNESSDLGDSDPRWQWAYRAKILAVRDNPEMPLLTDPEVLHINRKYPLLFSAVEAVTLRLLGGTEHVAALRAIVYGYFLSLALLVASFPARGGSILGSIATLAVLVTIPKLWVLGVDEVYVDLPLGVTALLIFLWLAAGDTGPARVVVLTVLGAAMAGLKAEGILLVLCLAGCYAIGHVRTPGILALIKGLIPVGIGLAAALGLHSLYLKHIPADVGMENVQFSDFKFPQLLANTATLQVVAAYFVRTLGAWRLFGLFFPLCLGCALVTRSRQALLPLAMAVCYAGIMVVPFVFSRMPLDFHLQVVVPRMYCQVIPLLAFTVFLGLSRLGERVGMPRVQPAPVPGDAKDA